MRGGALLPSGDGMDIRMRGVRPVRWRFYRARGFSVRRVGRTELTGMLKRICATLTVIAAFGIAFCGPRSLLLLESGMAAAAQETRSASSPKLSPKNATDFWMIPNVIGQAAAAEGKRSSNSIKTILRTVDELEAHAQRITLSIAQLTLGFDIDANLTRLRNAHNGFEQTLEKMFKGDESIGLPPPSGPKMVGVLGELRVAWDIHKGVSRDVIEAGQATRKDLAIAAQLDQMVIDAAIKAREAYQEKYLGNNLVSIDVLALIQAEQQAFRVEKMAKRLLLIALEYDVEKQREHLATSTLIFNRVLNGMIDGDSELRLIPVRDPALRTELARSKRAWARVQPQLDLAVKGTPPAIDELRIVDGEMELLLQSTEKAIDIIEKM